jgi:hypothetical protein
MRETLKGIFIAAAMLGLAGCAGTDFVRPGAEEMKIGQTTYAQVIARMGAPRQEGTALVNDKNVKSATYAYASTGGAPRHSGVTPARAQSFSFYNDVLVGQEFLSSWAEDHTDFDESKVQSIIKGTTTRAQLVQLMGRPSGSQIYPLIKSEKGEAATYSYVHMTGSVFTAKFYRKKLVVTFEGDVATDVEYTSAGEAPAARR